MVCATRSSLVAGDALVLFLTWGNTFSNWNEGRKLNSTSIWTKGYPRIPTAFFPPLGKYTKFPFILAIPQHVTEDILHDAAKERGITVHRPVKVTDLRPNKQANNFTDVTSDNGHVLRARCVVGADGSRSTVCTLST